MEVPQIQFTVPVEVDIPVVQQRRVPAVQTVVLEAEQLADEYKKGDGTC